MMITLITIGTEFSSYTSLKYTYSWLFFWATKTHTSNIRYCLCNGRKHLGLVGEAGIDKKKVTSCTTNTILLVLLQQKQCSYTAYKKLAS